MQVDNSMPQKIFSSSFVPASGLQVRRLLRTGELDEKVAKLHIPARTAQRSLSLLRNKQFLPFQDWALLFLR